MCCDDLHLWEIEFRLYARGTGWKCWLCGQPLFVRTEISLDNYLMGCHETADSPKQINPTDFNASSSAVTSPSMNEV